MQICVELSAIHFANHTIILNCYTAMWYLNSTSRNINGGCANETNCTHDFEGVISTFKSKMVSISWLLYVVIVTVTITILKTLSYKYACMPWNWVQPVNISQNCDMILAIIVTSKNMLPLYCRRHDIVINCT